MNEKLRDLLYRSFDSGLTGEERKRLDQALAESSELRAEREQIAEMRGALKASSSDSFGPFFAERVMQNIGSTATNGNGIDQVFESMAFIFRRVAIAGAVAAAILIAVNMKSTDDISLSAAFAMPQENIEDVFESPLESILE